MAETSNLLIQKAEVSHCEMLDVRCNAGFITECSEGLKPIQNDTVINAQGCALIPGLHDHHIHLFSLAARLSSVECGPPSVSDIRQLTAAIRGSSGGGWIRGVGYHESVAGILNRKKLDAIVRDRPVRIQHRSGRVWWLNTLALNELGMNPSGNGELFRMDERVRRDSSIDDSLKSDLGEVYSKLLSMGVTGVTDATPSNDESTVELLRNIADNRINVSAMGNELLKRGHLKLLIDDYRLPKIDLFEQRISSAHLTGRPVAIHCVSRVELVFALAALQRVGVLRGDRIEHASVVDSDTLELIRDLGLTVVTQPNFIYERGEQYVNDLPSIELESLYRIGGLMAKRIAVGGGTDAPFGSHDPWLAIRSAVDRKTVSGRVLNGNECIDPDRALCLFTTSPEDPGGQSRLIEVGQPADMVLLSQPWKQSMKCLTKENVRMTIVRGKIRYNRDIETTPAPCG